MSVTFKLEAVAAAMILRAKDDMSDYIIVNYDSNEKIVKAWTANRLLGSVKADVNASSITLKARLSANDLTVYLGGESKLKATLSENDPLEGRFGLNVFNGKATFEAVALVNEEYVYDGGNLEVYGDAEQAVMELYNVTLRNAKVNAEFFTCDGRKLTLSEEYFKTLGVGSYRFKAFGRKSTFTFTVDVKSVAKSSVADVKVNQGLNATVYLGNLDVSAVTVNGRALKSGEYTIKNKVLYINKEVLTLGENTVTLGNTTIKVTVV